MSARLYLVAYDVSSPARWRRVIKAVRRLCRRSQLSVFVCRGTPARIDRLEKELRRHLDPDEDRLLIVDLGPAASAGAHLKSLNSITDIVELEGLFL